MTRIVQGYVNKISCRACSAVSYVFVFSGDTDMVTSGLAFLTSIKTKELVLYEMTTEEWNNYLDQSAAKDRISNLLKRDDLRVARYLGAEKNGPDLKGLSFQEFQKQYIPPTIIYACPICEIGEAPCIQKRSIAEYNKDGGHILCIKLLLI